MLFYPQFDHPTYLIVKDFNDSVKCSYFLQQNLKNKAHARAFEISLVLANKKPAYTYSQRMGDLNLNVSSPVTMDTVECMDCIMFRGHPDIQLKVLLQKILILKQNFCFTSKNTKKQNISQITSRFRQLFRITGL